VIATPTASERIAKVVKRGVAPSRLSANLMSRPTAVEGSTPGYLEAAAGVEMPSVVGEHGMADVRVHDDVRTPSMMPAFTSTGRSRWKSNRVLRCPIHRSVGAVLAGCAERHFEVKSLFSLQVLDDLEEIARLRITAWS
jgi:hypothetical protein